MTRFIQHTEDSAPENSRGTLKAVTEAYGFLPNLIATFAESPNLAEGYVSLSEIFGRSSLNATEQQIVLLTVSRFHECHYCMAAHTTISLGQDLDKRVVDAIRDDQPIDDAKLQALREFTEHLVEQRGWADEKAVAKVIAAGYSKTTILDVVLGIALKTMSNYTNHLAETPLDEPFAANKWQAPDK